MLVYQRVNDGYCHVWLLEGNKILNSKEPNRTGSPFQDDFSSKGQELHLYGQDIILWCHTSCTMQGWQRRFAAFLFQMVCIYIYIYHLPEMESMHMTKIQSHSGLTCFSRIGVDSSMTSKIYRSTSTRHRSADGPGTECCPSWARVLSQQPLALGKPIPCWQVG